ncbi:MAG: TIGR01212 family radical SAM protein [Chitinispirillaceae bacterium]|nr:TIGR01212 family radical SAM protein [Chitinispirillaceae bacterium]
MVHRVTDYLLFYFQGGFGVLMIHYLSYRSVVKSRYGQPVLKVPVNAGFSCPNRDGTKSAEGCRFCDNRSFSPVALRQVESPAAEQLRTALARRRGRNGPVLPYLQPFSNTYGTIEELKKRYEPLLAVPGVIGLAIGTRPDCFTEETYRYLAELARRTCLSIELGLQSAHDATLALCNRGHTFADFIAAVTRLSSDTIETVAHVMLGLPGETGEIMMRTADRLAALPCTGVKIHQLMVIEGTEFATWYREGRLAVLDLDEYAELLCGFLSHLRPDQQIHRIMADSTTANGLIAPLWSADKPGSLRVIHRYMDEHATRQGSQYGVGRLNG